MFSIFRVFMVSKQGLIIFQNQEETITNGKDVEVGDLEKFILK